MLCCLLYYTSKHSFIQVVCLTTGPELLPKRAIHIVRSRASSFKWGYPLLSLRSSSSFLRLLPRLPVTSIPPFIFPSVTRCRRQFLRKMWSIQCAFRLRISCRIFLCPLTLSNTSSFLTWSVQQQTLMLIKMDLITIPNYSQQYATFLEFIYFYRRSACLKRFLRSSSGAHNCTYSFRYCQPILLLAATLEEMERSSIPSKVAASSSVGWQYLKLYVQLCAPDDERRNRLKHVERL